MILVLLGPPASGKGTLAQSLVDKEGWKSYSAGQALRDHVKMNGKYARVAEKYLTTGRLVPISILMYVMQEFLRRHRTKKLLLDGTPRNIAQARAMEKALQKTHEGFTAFMFFDTTREVSWNRIRSRMQCSQCKRIYGMQIKPKKKGVCNTCHAKLFHRSDDTKKVLQARFGVFEKETFPLVEWAAQRYPVFYINANRSPQSALKQVKNALSLLR